MEEKKSRMRDVIRTAKEESLRVVEEYFCELEKSWDNEMRLEEKKHCLHDEYKLQSLASLLNREINHLVEQRFRLNPNTVVEEVPKWEKEVRVESRRFHQQTVEELEANEKYAPIIHYYPEQLSNLTQTLRSALQLQFNIPIQRRPSILKISNNSRISFESATLKKEPSTPTLTNQSMMIRRISSADKLPPSVQMTQSALYASPAQLNNSSLISSHNANKSPTPVFKQISSPKSKLTFSPNYVEGVDLSKYSRSERPDSRHLKQKKSGIMLFSSHNTA